jgi:hypothetical protein
MVGNIRVGSPAVKLLHEAEAASILIRGQYCLGGRFILQIVEAIGQSPKTFLYKEWFSGVSFFILLVFYKYILNLFLQ